MESIRYDRSEIVVSVILDVAATSGPLTGLELLNRTAVRAQLLTATPPNYAILHDLADEGLLRMRGDRPPTYAITDAGRAEIRRLDVRRPALRRAGRAVPSRRGALPVPA